MLYALSYALFVIITNIYKTIKPHSVKKHPHRQGLQGLRIIFHCRCIPGRGYLLS